MTERTRLITSLMILSIVLGGAAGCAPASIQPTLLPTPTVQPIPTIRPTPTLRPGWQTHSASAEQGTCGYAIDHPSEIEAAGDATNSWTLSVAAAEPSGPVPNFIYISVIPDELKSTGPGVIYNYDPAATQTLLNMQVGESRSLIEDPNLAPSYTYTRRPDTVLGNQSAQTYENTQPWEFPLGTKEIRYYLQVNGCTYMIGGYLATAGSDQPRAIDQELFEQIIATFRLAP